MTNETETTPSSSLDSTTRFNIRAESCFSALNGLFVGLALMAAPVVAVAALNASPVELTCLMAAFPVGVLLGPLWVWLGRSLGMQNLVVSAGVCGNLLFLTIFFVDQSWLFTLIIALTQALNAAMRMGQSSLYARLYPKPIRGRVLGGLNSWMYATMVPSILLAGWLLDLNKSAYRYIYPIAGVCGILGCCFYLSLKLPKVPREARVPGSRWSGLANARRVIVSDRAYLLYQCSFFLAGSAFFMSSHVVLLLVTQRFEFSAFELSLWMSVTPQLMLGLSSPIWGRVLDRVGIVWCRVLISSLICVYLLSYWVGIVSGVTIFICLGSLLFGLSNGGGQVTWALSSSYFAPREEDIPMYNGIHFVLNGVRGLIVPWIGSGLWLILGPGALLVALSSSAFSLPFLWGLFRLSRTPSELPEPALEGETPEMATQPTPITEAVTVAR